MDDQRESSTNNQWNLSPRRITPPTVFGADIDTKIEEIRSVIKANSHPAIPTEKQKSKTCIPEDNGSPPPTPAEEREQRQVALPSYNSKAPRLVDSSSDLKYENIENQPSVRSIQPFLVNDNKSYSNIALPDDDKLNTVLTDGGAKADIKSEEVLATEQPSEPSNQSTANKSTANQITANESKALPSATLKQDWVLAYKPMPQSRKGKEIKHKSNPVDQLTVSALPAVPTLPTAEVAVAPKITAVTSKVTPIVSKVTAAVGLPKIASAKATITAAVPMLTAVAVSTTEERPMQSSTKQHGHKTVPHVASSSKPHSREEKK